ncbi:hypothetical protein VE03_02068 [Pseudogymnoascus sp. 23342-1-I1]|nr:hypothetical protein VE03_02068 [Pseudogymnoascus sp. 23342-1-I1]
MESQYPAQDTAWLAMNMASQALSEPILQSIEGMASPSPFSDRTPSPSLSFRQPLDDTDNDRLTTATKLVRLTDDDMLVVLRLCLQEQAAYGHQSDRMFWRLIARRLREARGKEHKTLSRAVAKVVRERRESLALLGSGEQDAQSSMTDALDAWIAVVDARKEVKQARLDAQGTADAETATSTAWRQASLALWADKTQVLRAASRAYQRDEDDDESSAPSETPPLTAQRRPQRRRRQATSTSVSASPSASAFSPPSLRSPSMPLPQEDPIAIGLGRLVSVVESVASRIGIPQEEENREELDAAVEKRLDDLESKISVVNENVAMMLAMMVEQRQRQGG